MADTYHPQQIGLNQLTLTIAIVPAISRIVEHHENQLLLTSSLIPNTGIFSVMELYAPGSLIVWPDNTKPQYRVPSIVTGPFVPPTVPSNFPALLVAF